MCEVAQVEPLLTADEVGRWLRKHERQVRNMARAGELPGAVQIGSTWRFERAAIEHWVKSGGHIEPAEK